MIGTQFYLINTVKVTLISLQKSGIMNVYLKRENYDTTPFLYYWQATDKQHFLSPAIELSVRSM